MSTGTFIGQVAQTAGVGVQTIRYYERLGLLPPTQRTDSGYRVYGPGTVERLRFIRQAQVAGFRLEEIKEILRLKYAGQSPCDCVRELLREKLKQVEREMAGLTRFRHELQKTLKRSRKLPRLPHSASTICPIIEKRASRQRRKKGIEKQ